jgi:SOS-response transcriptional repressor LexA
MPHDGDPDEAWNRRATDAEKVGLTKRQREALDAIKAHIEATGTAPSQNELCRILKTGKGNVNRLVSILHRKGHIIRQPYMANAITII